MIIFFWLTVAALVTLYFARSSWWEVSMVWITWGCVTFLIWSDHINSHVGAG